MDNGKKNALKVLTTNDIRKHARDWTLAGDVGLLAHLEQFSENIINKTQETQANFNELVEDYEELYTKVGNITNQFLALQNCQFVENRVYDEETPTEEKPEVKVQNEADQEKLLLMQYKEAVEVGIKLLDTHFQEVQLPPNSDSDDEDEVSPGNSVIWKPKNPYASKKFPFLIGSSEWWADDNVGLRPNKDSLDTEKIVSESESDMESLKSVEKTMKSSSSSSSPSSSVENVKSIPTKPTFMESSEDLFGFDKNNDIVKANNASDDFSKGSGSLLVEEPVSFLPEFEKETAESAGKKSGEFSDEYPTVTRQTEGEKPSQNEVTTNKPKKVDNEFTRELMAKLVSVTNKTENGVLEKKEQKKEKEEEEEEKTRKKEKKKEGALPPGKRKPEEDGLFDETDDGNDLFSARINEAPKKTEGKRGLFFDAENDDDLFKGENDLFSGSSLFESDVFKKGDSSPTGKNDFGARTRTKTTEEKKEKKEEATPPKKKNVVNDLFEDLDDEEDTLFAAKPVNQKGSDKRLPSMEKDSFKETKPPAAPVLAWDNDEGLFDSINTQIDDDFFNSSGLFDTKVTKVDSKNKEAKSEKSEAPPKAPQTVIKPENNVDETTKKVPALGSNVTKPATDTFDDPFGFSSSKDTGRKKISILDSEEEEEDDLFSAKNITEGKKQLPAKSGGATTLLVDDDEDAALFGGKPKSPDSVSVSSSRSSLFDDVSASKSRLASVFERDKPTRSEETLNHSKRDLFSNRGREGKTSLFDDCDDGDDLFSAGTKTGTKQKSLFDKLSEESQKIEKNDKKSTVDKSEDGDLFKSLGTPTKLRGTKSDIFRHSEQKLFGDDPLDTDDLFSDSSTTAKPKPPSSLSLKPKDTEPKGQTVGKLNIPDNLKVKFESVAKKISPGGVGKFEKQQEEEKKEEVLDEPIQPSTLLKCPSKDRVKIPGKRRPQSRRARQEAIRNSGNWDQPLSSGSATNVSLPGKDSAPSPVVSNPLSPSTDEEDFFKVPELDTNFEKEDQSIFKSDLFESSKTSKLDDSLLFDGAPVLSPLTPKKTEEKPAANKPETGSLFGSAKPKIGSIFDDDDDDDLNPEDDESLFKTTKPAQNSVSHETPKKPERISLFDADLDEDEDDLFGGKTQATPSKPPPVEKSKEGGGDPKGKGNSSFVDPLGLMTNNE